MRAMRSLVGLLSVVAAALVVAATAGATTTIGHSTFSGDITLCNSGDDVSINGQILVVTTTTTTPSGGFVSAIHFQPQGLTGVDTTTGTIYRAVGLTRDLVVNSPAGGSTETFVNRFFIQATGGAESFKATETYHVTISPDGTVTVEFDKLASTC